MVRKSLIISILMHLTLSAAVADEYTDSLTGVVYTYEKGSGVAKVKNGEYHAWDGRTRGVMNSTKDIVILDSFMYDGHHYTVNEIGDYAFYYRDVQSIRIPSTITTIGDKVFQGCSKLCTVYLPDRLESLGLFAFSRCDQLTSIIFPNQMTVIPRGAFESCRRLREVDLPESLNEIGDMSFVCCSSLHEIVIPENVTRIGMGALSDCDSLCKVTIPSKIASIENCAFSRNPQLSVIISQIEEPFSIDADVFGEETYENATLYVPTGSKSKYEAATGWSLFKTVLEGSPTAIQPSSAIQKDESTLFDLRGQRLASPPSKGIYIQNGRKVMVNEGL